LKNKKFGWRPTPERVDTMTNKMTKKVALGIAIEAIGEKNPEAVEVLSKMVTQLEKRATGERKPSKTQVANEGVKAEILEVLTSEGAQCGEIAVKVGISGQKCSALLKQLVEAGLAEKFSEKRVTYFRAVEG